MLHSYPRVRDGAQPERRHARLSRGRADPHRQGGRAYPRRCHGRALRFAHVAYRRHSPRRGVLAMARDLTYTLADFARDWKTPAEGKPVLGDPESYTGKRNARRWIAVYRAQCVWNRATERLLADPTPWHARPVPAPDWSPKGMARWARENMSDWPPAQSAESKAFRAALKATGPGWERDATPTLTHGACAECLYSEMNVSGPERRHHYGAKATPARLAAISHTCDRAAVKGAA